MADDPLWPRASSWIAGETAAAVSGILGLFDIPLGSASITPGHYGQAPKAIREALQRFSTYEFETGLDIRRCQVLDFGAAPVESSTPEQAFETVRGRVIEISSSCGAAILLGGDNSITRPGVHGMGLPLSRCGLITLDAHFDLRSLDTGLSNGNPVRALLADGLPGSNIVQIGLQSFANSPVYAAVAREAGICSIPVGLVRARGIDEVVGESLELLSASVDAIYFDLDLDVLDRCFSPATPGSRPGGLSPAEILRAAWLFGAHPKVKAMDLVEVDPTRDIGGVTVMTAASAILHFAAGFLTR